MPIYTPPSDRVLSIYLTLTEYPILSTRIRYIMRKQLFERGILSREAFDAEVRQKAIEVPIAGGTARPVWRGGRRYLGRTA